MTITYPRPVYGNATGNTFLIFDYIFSPMQVDVDYVRKCHAARLDEIDSCLVLEKSSIAEAKLTIKMRVYEPGDGFCGNGARAISKFLHEKYSNVYSSFAIKSGDYVHELVFDGSDHFVEMGESVFADPKHEFVNAELTDGKLSLQSHLSLCEKYRNATIYYAQTSEPHLITFDQMDNRELEELGTYLNTKCTAEFPIGININRVSVLNGEQLEVTTFERGINRLTKACGTGSISAVSVALKLGKLAAAGKISVKVPGGTILCHKDGQRTLLGGDVIVHSQ